MRFILYQITNLVNGKIYIGKHACKKLDDTYFGSGKLLKRAIAKHGKENFMFHMLIELFNKDELDLLEKCVVTEEFCARDDVYNIKPGGKGGSYKGINKGKSHPSAMKGKKFTDEQRAEISRRTKLAMDALSPSQREKLRSRLGKAPPNKGMKMREEDNASKWKPVSQHLIDGTLVAIYKSAKEASINTGICRSSISACIKRRYKSAGGYLWQFA